MASIRETRKKLMPVVVTLVVLDLACVGYLLSPAGRSRQARQRDYYELRDQLTAKQQEVLPTRGMDQKLSAGVARTSTVLWSPASGASIPRCPKSWARWPPTPASTLRE